MNNLKPPDQSFFSALNNLPVLAEGKPTKHGCDAASDPYWMWPDEDIDLEWDLSRSYEFILQYRWHCIIKGRPFWLGKGAWLELNERAPSWPGFLPERLSLESVAAQVNRVRLENNLRKKVLKYTMSFNSKMFARATADLNADEKWALFDSQKTTHSYPSEIRNRASEFVSDLENNTFTPPETIEQINEWLDDVSK